MNVRPFFGLLALCLLGACRESRSVYLFTSFREPATAGLYFLYSRDGYHWKDLGGPWLPPDVGPRKLMRDPSIVQGPDGVFHLVWTTNWSGDKGFGYAFSTDLIHWSPQQFIPVMEDEPSTVNVWAPDLFYDKDSSRFVIVWASTIPFRFPKGQEPENDNQRLYYATTKDFKTFTPERLFLDPGFSSIDATIVQPGPGQYVLVFKDNTRPERDIKVAFASSVLGPYTNVSPSLTAEFTEGPTATRVGKDWLIYYDAYRKKMFGAARTRDFHTFTDITAQVSVPKGHKHGTIFMVTRKTLRGLQEASTHLQIDTTHATH
ncbi:glycoside hydrolase family 43 protein [Dinghuibacter silviterrae]|uniref:Arabinosidase BT-3657-like N-terminal domain-containing protein n=1 Tax=Dinghuibacter silviterrae TaxID=1539049 RepID=A0A4V3GLZ2_9BACT|nr:glycoside hydrolase family 43 protein [Dinghuibacter silviterrae]TDX01383.1 hypothetical protein EDB95_2417 [Dinghuibacter silviterrae]